METSIDPQELLQDEELLAEFETTVESYLRSYLIETNVAFTLFAAYVTNVVDEPESTPIIIRVLCNAIESRRKLENGIFVSSLDVDQIVTSLPVTEGMCAALLENMNIFIS